MCGLLAVFEFVEGHVWVDVQLLGSRHHGIPWVGPASRQACSPILYIKWQI